MDNIILNTDTYKATHFTFEDEGTEFNYGYIEARKGGDFNEVMFFGLQYFLQKYLLTPITAEMIDEAEAQLLPHVGVFNREGWEYILWAHNGYLPVHIRAIPEGLVVPHGTPMVTIENTDPNCAWLAPYLETAMQRAVWYGSTIATRSWRWKNLLLPLLAESGSPETIEFKIVDFGARGVECAESAAIAGAAHLINSQVTDNQLGIWMARKYYNADMPGFSIPATEHSVTTSWGKDRELAFYEAILRRYGNMPRNPDGSRRLVSVVIDTYDQDAALRKWESLKDELERSNMCLVARPDSGDPVTNTVHVVNVLTELFGYTVNDRGFLVLPDYVRCIIGDGIDETSLVRIAKYMNANKLSLDNLNFGSGGGLLQKDVTRDTHRFAQKTSQVVVNSEVRDVQKTVATDPTKASKAGRFSVIRGDEIVTIPEDTTLGSKDLLRTVYIDGRMMNIQTFEDVRNANR